METAISFLMGLVGLISIIIKYLIDVQKKKGTPDGRYGEDIQKFEKALAAGNPDDISLAFEQLRRESEKRGSDTSGSNGNEVAKR